MPLDRHRGVDGSSNTRRKRHTNGSWLCQLVTHLCSNMPCSNVIGCLIVVFSCAVLHCASDVAVFVIVHCDSVCAAQSRPLYTCTAMRIYNMPCYSMLLNNGLALWRCAHRPKAVAASLRATSVGNVVAAIGPLSCVQYTYCYVYSSSDTTSHCTSTPTLVTGNKFK
jgi:hypothetical protein